jgi:CDP-diacylglycerol--glycerol-3-phosphate 3-phosphatidyltransferase
MLDLRARKRVARFVDPIARVASKVGLTPTLITLLGFTLGIAGAVFIGLGELALGAGLYGGGALLDILDGVLARLTGTETRRGALLDTFTDRLGEVAGWTGLAYYLGEQAEAALVTLTIVALAGSLLVPFVRSKAQEFGVEGKGGVMGRAERLLVFCLGVGLSGFGLPTLEPTLWALAVLVWLTVIQRFVRTWKQLADLE